MLGLAEPLGSVKLGFLFRVGDWENDWVCLW